MWLWLSLLAFAIGVLVGRFSVRRWRHDRIAWAQRRLQLKVLSLEIKSLRSKMVSAQGRRTPPAKRHLVRKLPTLKWWQRRLIAWLTTLYNQHVMAIDFKNTLDLAGNTMAVFNLIDHGRRVLYWSRATYNPTAEWVAQQLRNAFMDLDELPEAIVMDRDSIFLPIVKQTLPAMGIKTIRIGYKCPWQNAVVERFHRTLADELLRDVQPVNDRHLNRLLAEFRKYYNTARPHMACGTEPPVLPDVTNNTAANDPDFFKTPRKLVRQKWLGGLHSSYRWAA